MDQRCLATHFAMQKFPSGIPNGLRRHSLHTVLGVRRHLPGFECDVLHTTVVPMDCMGEVESQGCKFAITSKRGDHFSVTQDALASRCARDSCSKAKTVFLIHIAKKLSVSSD